MRAAENLLRNELRGESHNHPADSELALHEGQLPAAAAAKLHEVHRIAEQMRARMENQTTAQGGVNSRTSARAGVTALAQ